ncbi:MAG: PfkB family carbohydrate kinase [Candidatus Limnocylindrales bacterium]
MVRPLVEVVHVGSASRDLASEDPRGWRLGGGVCYSALTTARLGLRTAALIGVDAEAASATELELLRTAGVEVRLLELEECPVFKNVETRTARVQTALAVGRPLWPPPDLPASWLSSGAWSFVPVAGEIDDRWTAVVAARATVAVGWQGWLRRLVRGAVVERRPPAPNALLERADLVGLSRDDVAPGTLDATLVRLLRPGARLLVTDGVAGGSLITVLASGGTLTDRYRSAPSAVRDPTGAGDTCLAALLAVTLRPELVGPQRHDVADALRFAAAAGSLVVEGIGIHGVPELAAVRTRAAAPAE